MENITRQLLDTILSAGAWLFINISDLLIGYGIDPIKLVGLLCVLYMIYHFTFEVGNG